MNRPILFSGPMVRAILAGEKTQTRRVVKPQPPGHHWETLPGYKRLISLLECNDGRVHAKFHDLIPQNSEDPVWRKCPYGKPGDRLWVRETWGRAWDESFVYRVDFGEKTVLLPNKWKPSIHMPRAASRVTLEITDIQIERVRDISRAAAKAEGFLPGVNGLESWGGQCFGNAQLAFEACWKDINSPRSWEDNPYVWVVEFRVV